MKPRPLVRSFLLRLAFACLALFITGCATTGGGAGLRYSRDVRQQSMADDVLFHDLVSGTGGVGFIDAAYYPQATARTLKRIVVTVPYQPSGSGVEEWTIEHDGNETVTYVVKLSPDGQGGTYFGIRRK